MENGIVLASNGLAMLNFAQDTGEIPVVSNDIESILAREFEASFTDMGNGSLRIMKVMQGLWTLSDSGMDETFQDGGVVVAFLGANPYNHAVWYERSYVDGQEPAAPDLCWIMRDGYWPEALPEQYRVKKNRSGQDRWDFQIKRRMAFALMRPVQNGGGYYLDLDHPFVMDVPAMSLYGSDLQEKNLYRYSGLKSLCDRLSRGGQRIYPYMFLMQLLVDRSVTVNGVFVFKPFGNPETGKGICFLDAETIQKVITTATSESVRNILAIKETLNYGNGTTVYSGNEHADLGVVDSHIIIGSVPPPVQAASPAPAPAPVQAPAPAPAPAPVIDENKNLLQQAEEALKSNAQQVENKEETNVISNALSALAAELA